MKIKISSILLFILAACSSKSTSILEQSQAYSSFAQDTRSDMQLTEEQYVRLLKAVFEVVVPQVEDKNIVYEEEN